MNDDNDEELYLTIGWDGARVHCGAEGCTWSQPIACLDRLYPSELAAMVGAHEDDEHTYVRRCQSVINADGVEHQCNMQDGHEGDHRNLDAGLVWRARR